MFILAVVVISLVVLVWWFQPGRCNSTARLDGKIVIITGANTGIGKETAKDLLLRGATVIMACRDMTKGQKAKDEICEETNIDKDKAIVQKLDLSSLKSVDEFVEGFCKEFSQLHILVNNAGVMMCPYSKTEDGFELQIGVNHFGHFALTNLLLPKMKSSGNARIVNLSSRGHIDFPYLDLNDLNWEKKKYSDLYSYSQSKLCNVLFTKELHRKLVGSDITVYSVHPGAVATELLRNKPYIEYTLRLLMPIFLSYFVKSPKDGAQTSIYCCVEDIEHLSGEYFSDCQQKASHKMTYDEGYAKKLWEISEESTNVKFSV